MKRFQVSLFIVVGKVPVAELAHNFVRTLQRIESMLDERRPPFIAKVYRPAADEIGRSVIAAGRVELWYPKQ